VARRRNTLVTALFTYGQSIIGMGLGRLVTRVALPILGKDTWGLWAASGALLSYAGLADFGYSEFCNGLSLMRMAGRIMIAFEPLYPPHCRSHA